MPLPAPSLSCFEYHELGLIQAKKQTFIFGQGLSQKLVQQLKNYSLDAADTAIQEGTSDYYRFGVGDYEAWYNKKRMPFVALDSETGALAALIWFGPKTLGQKSLKHLSSEEQANAAASSDSSWHTVSYRAYNPYRGVGLMKPFCQETIRVYQELFPEAKLWLSVDTENEASFGLAEALGFVRDESLSVSAEHHYVYIFQK